MYDKIVKEFSSRPRDVHTVPTTAKKPVWFYVFVEKSTVYVEGGHNNTPKSNVKKRPLKKEEYNSMLELYHKRQNGHSVSGEAHNSSHSQVYWYGIFAELKL